MFLCLYFHLSPTLSAIHLFYSLSYTHYKQKQKLCMHVHECVRVRVFVCKIHLLNFLQIKQVLLEKHDII